MCASFSVLEQPWIPVRLKNGATAFYGIRDTLQNAHKIDAITDASPMTEYSLYRFLITMVMDIFRPEDCEDLEDLLFEGHFDAAALDEYYEMCQKEGCSFDLFDQDRPFLQAPPCDKLDQGHIVAIAKLDYTAASGNNHIHFDHRERVAYTYAEAAALLISAQLFCTSGLQGPSGVNGAPPYYTLIRGNSLFETLVCSMLCREYMPNGISLDSPKALWRETYLQITPKQEIVQTSLLYGMLFPARRIRLLPSADENIVEQIVLSQGLNYTAKELWVDPHTTYRENDKGRFLWRLNRKKAIWRNIYDLIDIKQKKAAVILQQYRKICESSQFVQLMIYGVETSQASYIALQRANLTFSFTLADNSYYLEWIQNAILCAEKMEKALRDALQLRCISCHITEMEIDDFYHQCERNLWGICEKDFAVQDAPRKVLMIRWIEKLIETAQKNYNHGISLCSLRADDMIAISEKYKVTLAKEVAKLKKKMKELKEGMTNDRAATGVL